MNRRYYVTRENERYAVKDGETGETVIYRPLSPIGLATAQNIAERINAKEEAAACTLSLT